jgi:hypothetical protein
LGSGKQRAAAGTTSPNEVRVVTRPDWQKLIYLVFDGRDLVAAFALRDDAQLWIEEFGNHSMKLRTIYAAARREPSGKSPAETTGLTTRRH